MTSTPELRFLNTGEVAIHYAEWSAESGNSNPACLFIHGITGRLETWLEVVDEIRAGGKAIAVDLRGHGRSGQTTGSYRLPDYARDIAILIEELELEPVIVIGHSLGAMTALQLVVSRPELVKALVLEDPPLNAREIMTNMFPERYERFGWNARLSGSGLPLAEMAEQLRETNADADEDSIQHAAMGLFLTDADAIMHVSDRRIDWSHEIESILRSVQCPALLLQGNVQMGGWMRDEDWQHAKSLMPGVEIEVWGDTGHLMHSDRPGRFVEQVKRFVARAGSNR